MAVRVTVYAARAAAEAVHQSTPARRQVADAMVGIAQPQAAVETGLFRSSYSVEQNGDEVFAVNNDPDAKYIVFGTSDTPPHDELINAGRQFGTYSGWQPK